MRVGVPRASAAVAGRTAADARGADIESGRNTPPKWDRLRLLPRHIRTALPLLPSGPGGVHALVIARSPEPDIQISNFRFETRDQTNGESGTRTRTGLSTRRASNAVPYQLGDLSKIGQGDKEKRRGGRYSPLLLVPLSFFSDGEGGIRTHGTRKGTTVFETARFSHSRTSPHKNSRVHHSVFVIPWK